MLRTNFIAGFRKILKDRFYSLINVGGLAIGLAGLGIAFIVGILSGIYPAIYLSGFNPVTVLKGLISGGRGGGTFRKVLVMVSEMNLETVIHLNMIFLQIAWMNTTRRKLLSAKYSGTLPS